MLAFLYFVLQSGSGPGSEPNRWRRVLAMGIESTLRILADDWELVVAAKGQSDE